MKYSPFRHIDSVFMKSDPVQLTFFLTRKCNAKCPFCFYLHHNKELEKHPPELSIDEIRKVSDSMGKLLWLAFSGGEIFLRNDIVDITRVFYENNKPSIILLPTNGLLTNIITDKVTEILELCKKSAVVVKLSIDGPEDVNDELRGIRGAFKKTMETYASLGRLFKKYPNFELGINTVFCSKNQDLIDETIKFVNGLENIRSHTVSLIRGDISDINLKDIDINKYHKTIKKMESDLKNRKSGRYRFTGARLKAAQDIIQRRLIHETSLRKKQLIRCYAGIINVVLTETGDIFPCESFAMKIGNIRENGYDITAMLKTEEAKKIRELIRKRGCYCTHECYFMTNILFNPLFYPKLLKEYFKIR